MLQPIPTDTHDFPEIRGNGCIYVDKTAYFHKLIMMKDARRGSATGSRSHAAATFAEACSL